METDRIIETAEKAFREHGFETAIEAGIFAASGAFNDLAKSLIPASEGAAIPYSEELRFNIVQMGAGIALLVALLAEKDGVDLREPERVAN